MPVDRTPLAIAFTPNYFVPAAMLHFDKVFQFRYEGESHTISHSTRIDFDYYDNLL